MNDVRPIWSPIAKKFLTNLQRAEYERIGAQLPDWSELVPRAIEKLAQRADIAYGSKEYAALHEKISAELGTVDLPTPYENPNWYKMVGLCSREIESAASSLQRSIGTAPLMGSIPSSMANAITVNIPRTGENLLVFSAGLFLFLNLMAKLSAECMAAAVNATKPGKALDYTALPQILSASSFHKNFVDVLYAHVVLGNTSEAPQYFLRGMSGEIASTLRDAMELFVIGHEYGHIIEDHFSEESKTSIVAGEESLSFFKLEWKQELEADVNGLELMVKVVKQKGLSPIISLGGVHLFFVSLELIEKLVNILMAPHDKTAWIMAAFDEMTPSFGEGGRPNDSHPAPGLRRIQLRNYSKKFFPNEVEGGANELGEDIRAMLTFLWQASKPKWIEMRNSGVKPCPLWEPRATPPE